MKKQGFGTTKDGKEALLYTLSNKNGMEISVTDYGAHIWYRFSFRIRMERRETLSLDLTP